MYSDTEPKFGSSVAVVARGVPQGQAFACRHTPASAQWEAFAPPEAVVVLLVLRRWLADVCPDFSAVLELDVLVELEGEGHDRGLLQDLLGSLADADHAGTPVGLHVVADEDVLAPDVEAQALRADHAAHKLAKVQADPHVEVVVLDLRTHPHDALQHVLAHIENALAFAKLVCDHHAGLVHRDVGVAYGTDLVDAEQHSVLVKLGKEPRH
mmetsp:Transcript_116503/g.309934  ORF Transcript_116503/g.309934 Transcript_116503/m.309934 type:complete len:211 (+) Transcript_116503:98-730(+)